MPRLLFFCLDNNFIITSFLLSTFQLMLFLLGQIIVSVFFLFNKARNWANWDSISLILVFLPFFDQFGRTRDRHAQKGGSWGALRGAYDKIWNGLEQEPITSAPGRSSGKTWSGVIKHGVINKIKSTLSLKVAERLAEHSFAITRVTARVLN